MDPRFSNVMPVSRSRPSGLVHFFIAVLTAMFATPFVPSSPAAPPLELPSVKISGVPHVEQRPDFGGEACAEMFLRKRNSSLDQDDVFEQSGVDPVLGRGCNTRELAQALERLGFKAGRVWYSIPAQDAWPRLNDEFAALHADLQQGVPSIVRMRFDGQPQSPEQFRLVLGYDSQTDEVLYHDPAEARGGYQRMSRPKFLRLWPLKGDTENWTVVRLRLEADHLIRPPGRVDRFTSADYAQHIRKLRARVPEGFTVVLQRPFVVLGNEAAETVRSRVENTVDWAVSRLKRDYFDRNPAQIIDIWLFQDGFSYEEFTQKLFGEKPTTPYGFYSPRHRALVMNIATGGGTLVHEIVHPFMASNFPECPSWFNEGLASLYEQARDRDGHIAGLPNWRLRGLQAALHDGQLPSFEKLCATTTREFYDHDRGTNYAQARYLCYYLQEHGLLVKFYRDFRRRVATDPTGIETLKSILHENDLAAFQNRWEKFVLKLEYEP
jgi:Papain-like cysteine protease AvrRpt2